MGFAVSEISFTPQLPAPMTYDRWREITRRLDSCLKARNIQWLYSLVSVNGDRSVCVYQVPYAEVVREAYREARMPFQQVWQSTGFVSIPDMDSDSPIVVIEAEGNSSIHINSCLEKLRLDSAVNSVILSNGIRSLNLFSTTSIDVRQLHDTNSIPSHIWQATLIQPLT